MIKNTVDLLDFQKKTFEECRDIIKNKNHDYSGGDTNPFSNFEASKALGVDPIIGILVRSMDKFKRIETFVKKGVLKVPNESIEDAFNDIINYMILGKGIVYNAKLGECFDEEPPAKIDIYEERDKSRLERKGDGRWMR